MFKYWNLTLNLDLPLLHFVESIKNGDFDYYIYTLFLLAPWLLTLNHLFQVAKIHIKCMINLEEDKQTCVEFMKEKFVVQKYNPKCSTIGWLHNDE